MPEIPERCAVCLALLDEEDLFCANCGTEVPGQAAGEVAPPQRLEHNFRCANCGASMSYDASAQNLRCPFCDSERLESQPDAPSLAPRRVVPFSVSREQVEAQLRRWMGASFWRPGDLAQRSVVTRISPVYVPYWVFAASTLTHWNADSSQTPPGARADWYPVHGQHRASYQGILVGASAALTPRETAALCPFDLGAAVAPDRVDLENAVYEPFTVQRKYARPLATSVLEELERQACARLVPGRARNVKTNVRLEGLSSEPVLLPVWILAYQYRRRLYRVVVNGQTSKLFGSAPWDWKKPAGIFGVLLLLLLGWLLLQALGRLF